MRPIPLDTATHQLSSETVQYMVSLTKHYKSKEHLIPTLQNMPPQIVIHISTPVQILLEALWQETTAGPSLCSIARDIFDLVPSCLKDDSQVWALFSYSLDHHLLGGRRERTVLSSGYLALPPHATTD